MEPFLFMTCVTWISFLALLAWLLRFVIVMLVLAIASFIGYDNWAPETS